MQKEFNTTGTCIPEKHYMADTSKKLEKVKVQGKFLRKWGLKLTKNFSWKDLKKLKITQKKLYLWVKNQENFENYF